MCESNLLYCKHCHTIFRGSLEVLINANEPFFGMVTDFGDGVEFKDFSAVCPKCHTNISLEYLIRTDNWIADKVFGIKGA